MSYISNPSELVVDQRRYASINVVITVLLELLETDGLLGVLILDLVLLRVPVGAEQ